MKVIRKRFLPRTIPNIQYITIGIAKATHVAIYLYLQLCSAGFCSKSHIFHASQKNIAEHQLMYTCTYVCNVASYVDSW